METKISRTKRRRISRNSLSTVFRQSLSLAGLVLVNGVTLPYYRFYRQNTLLPIQSIAQSVQARESTEIIAEKLKRWRDRKLHEFQFVQVAATLLAAAVIGCFSWSPQIEQQQHWLGPAAWYCSLVLSITAVLLSSSEAFIFSAIKNAPPPASPITARPTRGSTGTPCAAEEPPGHTPTPTQQESHAIPSQRLSQELSMIMHVQFIQTGPPHGLSASGPATSTITTDDMTVSAPGSPLPTARTRTRTSTTLRGEDPEADATDPNTSHSINSHSRHTEGTPRNRRTSRRNDPESQEEEQHGEGASSSPHRGGPVIKVDIRWNMVFTWQAPIMLMGYSVVAYYLGLVVYVCAPLYDGHEGQYFNGPGKAAVLFLVWSGLSGGIFVWCSYWAYRFVELDGL